MTSPRATQQQEGVLGGLHCRLTGSSVNEIDIDSVNSLHDALFAGHEWL